MTISWTKFHYSPTRAPGYPAGGEVHHFSDLIGGSDTATGDVGHLRVTLHHDWWAENVVERMPRVRFGKVHIFNSLYTAAGNNYCIGLGFDGNILTENTVFVGVNDPIDSTSHSNPASIVVSKGNVYDMTTGTTADKGGPAFTPPYPYVLDAASAVQAAVKAGAGPK